MTILGLDMSEDTCWRSETNGSCFRDTRKRNNSQAVVVAQVKFPVRDQMRRRSVSQR